MSECHKFSGNSRKDLCGAEGWEENCNMFGEDQIQASPSTGSCQSLWGIFFGARIFRGSTFLGCQYVYMSSFSEVQGDSISRAI